MRTLGAFRRRLDDAQLVERSEDDPFGATELRLENLDHRDLGPVKLQHTASCTGRRIVYPLSQLDDVKGGDFVGYRHGNFMLRGRVGGYQSRCGALKGVMPGNNYEGTATVEREPGLYFAGNAERRAITNFRNCGVERRFCNCSPNKLSVNKPYPENPFPFAAMSSWPEDPIQLGSLIPGIRGAGKRASNFRWPWHGSDARDRNRACVQQTSILRVSNQAKAGRLR